MSAAFPHPLIAAPDLQARLGESALFVLDVRPRDAFEAGHVPGAVHSDYETGGWRVRAEGGLGLLPRPEQLSALFGGLGLSRQDAVVIVSAGEGVSDLAAAARVYWTLKVARHPTNAVLDGGYRAWAADPSRPVERGPAPSRPATAYPVEIDESLRSDLAATAAALKRGGTTFLDARSAAYYEGREKAASVRAGGHIPGARSLDFSQSFDAAASRLRPPEELEKAYAAAGTGPVVSYCNSGHSAALNWFVLSEVLGRPDIRLFDGSMSQWTQDPERPVETGPAKA